LKPGEEPTERGWIGLARQCPLPGEPLPARPLAIYVGMRAKL
jgi:hypothetical protein